MEDSKIEWTDHTFNPWIGCTKISPACKHCYAEALDKRWGRANWGPNATRTRTSDANWKKPLAWNRKAAKEGIRRKVFCASLADVFEQHGDANVNGEMQMWRDELFHIIESTPHLDWLLLTKRPENVMGMVPNHWIFEVEVTADSIMPWGRWPSNVWIGTTVENQAEADKRIPELLKIPARARFLSCEPMLGPIDLHLEIERGPTGRKTLNALAGIERRYDYYGDFISGRETNKVDWVICGGESGHGARPMHPDWARSLRDQCASADVPFLFKQWGEWVPTHQHPEGGQVQGAFLGDIFYPHHMVGGEGIHMRRVGKKAAGRMLDGVEHNAFPA
jgi:protein gp37